ncbi:MAG TPA: hypothetical protein VGE67_18630 [Haloferula sp.]
MLKSVIIALAAFLTCRLAGAEYVLVSVGYAERLEPQGIYLLIKDDKGLVSLDAISKSRKLGILKVGGIVPALEKAYPELVGRIALTEASIDEAALAVSGEVHVLGQVEKPGEHSAGSLAACLGSAKPTPFGAVNRIEVIRKQERHVYDLKKAANAEAKLEPGDIVLVPMKRVIGN